MTCPSLSIPSATGTRSLGNTLYPYSMNVPGEWPSSGALTLTMTIRPTSFANTTACGPDRGSSLRFYMYADGKVPSGIADPVLYNEDKSLVS